MCHARFSTRPMCCMGHSPYGRTRLVIFAAGLSSDTQQADVLLHRAVVLATESLKQTLPSLTALTKRIDDAPCLLLQVPVELPSARQGQDGVCHMGFTDLDVQGMHGPQSFRNGIAKKAANPSQRQNPISSVVAWPGPPIITRSHTHLTELPHCVEEAATQPLLRLC